MKGMGNGEASRRPNRQIIGVPEKVIQEIFPELKKKLECAAGKGLPSLQQDWRGKQGNTTGVDVCR